MKENKVNKIVRITGATVGKSPFSPFRVLFTILLSFSGKWHESSEIAIRESNVDYTILRPTGIVDEPSAMSQNRSLVLVPGSSKEKVKIPSKISVCDLADLITLSVTNDKLRKCTVICSSSDVPGEASWAKLVDQKVSSADTDKLTLGPYKLAVSVYLTSLSMLLGVIVQFLTRFALKLVSHS